MREFLIKGSNYLETLAKTKLVVFDKTGTLTKGVFEVNGIHHSELENQKLLEYAALAESASSHPISKSIRRAYGQELDHSRVRDIEEISGERRDRGRGWDVCSGGKRQADEKAECSLY